MVDANLVGPALAVFGDVTDCACAEPHEKALKCVMDDYPASAWDVSTDYGPRVEQVTLMELMDE